MWKVAKSLKPSVKYTLPLLDEKNKRYSTNLKKSAILAERFQKSHELKTNNGSRYDTTVDESMRVIQSGSESSLPVEALARPKELRKLVKKLNTKKSPGEDNINYRLLKQIPMKAIILPIFHFQRVDEAITLPHHLEKCHH